MSEIMSLLCDCTTLFCQDTAALCKLFRCHTPGMAYVKYWWNWFSYCCAMQDFTWFATTYRVNVEWEVHCGCNACIQLVPPTDQEMTGTLGHLWGSNEPLQTQKGQQHGGNGFHTERMQYAERPCCTRTVLVMCLQGSFKEENVMSLLLTWQRHIEYLTLSHRFPVCCIVPANSAGSWQLSSRKHTLVMALISSALRIWVVHGHYFLLCSW